MVLDDSPGIRALIVTTLRDGGFEVFEAATGEEALELAHSRAPDLIVADPLRTGMDSDEFALSLGADPAIAKTRVVFSAAIGDAREVWGVAEAGGVSHILITPCAPAVIAHLVSEILAKEPR